MRILLILPLLLAGCGGDPPVPAPPAVGEVRLGMTPDEVAAAAGVPDRTMSTTGAHGFEIRWTYKRSRHLLLKGEAGANLDFPRGCQLVFGDGGRTLTSIQPLGVP